VTRMPGRAHAACAQALALPCLRRERLLPRAATGSSRPIGDIGCLELGAPELPVADEPRRATGWIACTSVQGHLKRAVELGVQLL